MDHNDRNRWQELEDRAAVVDALAAGERTVEAVAEEFAKRRFLLGDLQAEGLLEEEGADERRNLLEDWGLRLLVSYQDAALAIIQYLRSDERRSYIEEAALEPVLGSPVALDWFRFPRTPPKGYSQFEWLGHCEFMMKAVEIGRGGTGTVLFKVYGVMHRAIWRRDDGIHAALAVAEPVPLNNR